MLSLNQVIRSSFIANFCKSIFYRRWGNLYIALIMFFFTTTLKMLAQEQLQLPTEFQNISVNLKALEKDFEFILNPESSKVTQNFILDKTGVILHLKPSSEIKNNTTKIRIFSTTGEESEMFHFIDNSLFALVDPEKTYYIVQEIIPSCDRLTKIFNLDNSASICPDSIAYKLYNNIMIDNDTSLPINLQTPSEFYKIPLSLPPNTQQSTQENNQNPITIITTKSSETKTENPKNINLASLLKSGRLCFVSGAKSNDKAALSECSFTDPNIKSLIIFKNNFKEKMISNQNTNLLFSFLPNKFNTLNHDILFEFNEDIKSQNKAVEITRQSQEQLHFDNYDSNLKIKLGQIIPIKTRVKKNIFNLNNPIVLNKVLNKTTINIPLGEIEAIINPFTDMSKDSFLTNLQIKGIENKSPNSFNISIDNNIVIKNLLDPISDTNTMSKAQITTSQDNLEITSYLPEGTFNLTFIRSYSSVEQTTAPSTDEKGKPIEIVNNKSRVDLVLSKNFSNNQLTSISDSLKLDIEKSSRLLDNKDFKDELSLSGFLSPPDRRPVIEEGYRATIELSMTINLKPDNFLKITYSDLKAKDETPLTNFFNFLFLPSGTYDANIKFDSDRTKLFQKAGVIKLEK